MKHTHIHTHPEKDRIHLSFSERVIFVLSQQGTCLTPEKRGTAATDTEHQLRNTYSITTEMKLTTHEIVKKKV